MRQQKAAHADTELKLTARSKQELVPVFTDFDLYEHVKTIDRADEIYQKCDLNVPWQSHQLLTFY